MSSRRRIPRAELGPFLGERRSSPALRRILPPLDFLRPHIRNHPALFVDGEHAMNVCNRCGESETLPCAKRYVANVLTYTMLRCANCKGYRRLSLEPERMSVVRGV